jgi:hypothetical protein
MVPQRLSNFGIVFFSFIVLDVTESNWCVGHYVAYFSIPGLWIMMSVEQSAKRLAAETKALGEHLPHCCFVYHKSLNT